MAPRLWCPCSRYDFAYAAPDDSATLTQINSLAAAGQVYRRLRSARLGVVGEHPAGMDSCHLDEPRLSARLGLSIVRIELAEVFERARRLQAQPESLTPIRSALETRLIRVLREVQAGQRTLTQGHGDKPGPT